MKRLFTPLLAALCVSVMATQALAGTIRLNTEDRVSLSADLQGKGTTGVVLVHDSGASSIEYGTYSNKLSSKVQVLSLNLRGHGTNKQTLSEADYPKMVADVMAAAKYLRGRGAERVVVVGSGFGATLALNAAAADQGIHSIVLLSPSLNSHGLKVASALGRYGERPLLVVASEKETDDARAARAIIQSAKGQKHLILSPTGGAGAGLLNVDPNLEGTLLSWYNDTFFASHDPGATRDALINTEVEDLESTGTRLEDRK